MEADGILMDMNRVYVPDSCESRKIILQDMYNVPYIGH